MREQLDRIEAKLDALITALAEEVEVAGPTEDLDGNPDPVHAGPTPEIDFSTL